LYTSNILFQLENFDEWSEADLYKCIGQPVKHKVCRLDGKPTGRNAPEYTVEAGNVAALESRLCADRILLIDFGEAFYHHEKPHEIFTAAPFASPELIFDGDITYAIDKWAFGCVLYEICAGISLFKLLFGWFNDIRKDQVAMLGKPPDLIWENWKNSKKYFYPDGTPKDPEGRGLKVELYSLEERVRNIARPPSERRYATPTTEVPLSKDLQHLYDLLRRIMLYDPGSRLSFESIQAHPLFCANN
jgi:serine/threonine-protein kinase SRPK3